MSNKTVYINFYDGINDKTVKILMAICSDVIAQHKPDILYFLFASGGGWVTAGITFHNFLRSLPVKVVMHNMGVIDSIATVIFLAGEERFTSPHSSFLFHGVEWTFAQQTSLSTSKLAEHSSQLKQDERKIANVYLERTALTDTEITELFKQGESKDPTFALEKKFIQEIKNPAVPKDAILISVNIN
ncbi:MAG TPA: ATP-dependent Clp protease proteolytic subunit [Anaerolineales bacterium]|nr:ATP-dependent Clp protease proteolytic subunit [Anaerolineales bacterium]HNE05485.1 ATP-dependent Clp protease proteolytic subunit [Anaerolineales bacterium]